MSVKNYIPAIKYGNAITSDEVDLSGATGDVTFTAGSPSAGTQSTTALNPAIGQTKTVNLTATQIQGMFNAPVTLVTTTTAGTAIVVDSVLFEFIGTATAYTAGGAVIVAYNGSTASSAGVLNTTVGGGVMYATTTSYTMLTQTNAAAGVTVLPNQGVSIGNQTSAFATGTGTAKVIVNYYIVTV